MVIHFLDNMPYPPKPHLLHGLISVFNKNFQSQGCLSSPSIIQEGFFFFFFSDFIYLFIATLWACGISVPYQVTAVKAPLTNH